MSTSFEIRSSKGNYSVAIGTGLFQDTLSRHASDVVIADEWFASMLESARVKGIILRATESAKDLESIPASIVELRKLGANRQTHLVALGGGVVQDVAGFIASIYMRGMCWTYVPTTLLAMADSCIGGKSSINVGQYKNLVGTFHPPASVVIDPELAVTLSPEQRISGLIEICKICYSRGENAFQQYLDIHPAPNMPVEAMERALTLSLLSKKWFIETDEFDRKERLLLNFGHTFGHAIESASDFRISHGVGVGVGMLCALELGRLQGRDYDNVQRVRILEDHVRALLADVPYLTGELGGLSAGNVMQRFESDKKHRTDNYTVVLVAASGDVELGALPKTPESRQLLTTAIANAFRKYRG